MKPGLIGAVWIFLSLGTTARAHRLDEYLQATIISLEKNRIHAEIRLTPGVAVFPAVMQEIDTNADGVISDAEQRAYADTVLRDLSFAIDGAPVKPHLVSTRFPPVDEMKEGRGEIELQVDANLRRSGSKRRLTFENHHEFRIAAYMVNCLVPHDPDIRIVAQNRSYSQSSYELDFVDSSGRSGLENLWMPAASLVRIGPIALIVFGWAVLLVRRVRRQASRTLPV